MARRFIEVEISKTTTSSVYIAIDDEDERFKEVITDGKLTWKGLRKLREDAIKAADDLSDYEWNDFDAEIEVEGGKVVEEKDARQYSCWDAVTGKTLES